MTDPTTDADPRPAEPQRPQHLALDLAVGMGLALAVMGLSRPRMFARITEVLWIPTGDPYVIGDMWGTLFLALRSARGEAGCGTTLFQWPGGADLCRDFPNSLFTELLAPPIASLGLPLGYNLALLALLLSNGLAVGLASRLSGAGRLGTLLATALGAATPMVFYEAFAGRPVTAWWAPAIAATALCVASMRSWRHFGLLAPGLGGLALALWIYPYAVVMLLPWTALLGVGVLLRGEGRGGRALRAALGLGAAAGVAWWVAHAEYGEALARFLAPLPYGDAESRWGLAAASVFQGVVHWHGLALVAAGVLPLALLSRGRPQGLLSPLIAAGLLVAVSLGPVPLGDPRRDAPEPTAPYVQLMERAPVMRGSARPDRYAIAAALLFAVAAGAACGRRGRWRGPRELIAALTLIGVTAFNHQLTPDTWFEWPPLDGLSAEGEGAALDLPVSFPAEDQAHMMAFAAWPAPRVNPLRQERQRWVSELRRGDWGLVQALSDLDRGVTRPTPPGPHPEVADGLRWVVLHYALMDASGRAARERVLREAGAVERSSGADVGVWELGP